MRSFVRYSGLAASAATLAHALNGIAVPTEIAADTSFQATFQNAGSDSYRVYLSAAVTGAQGPMCYLMNSTALDSPVNLTIPAIVGPDASYYSIGIIDLTTVEDTSYSNRFNLTGATGVPTQYEEHLDGAPFWDANKLPCSAMSCARQCANASYPDNLQAGPAYETMKNCFTSCPGVEPDASLQAAHSASSSISGAIITLASGDVVTAFETIVTTSGSTRTEAIVGSTTLVLGSDAATLASETLSLATNGVAIDGTTTMAFSNVAQTSSASATDASGASGTSSSSGIGGAVATAQAGLFAAAGAAAGFAAFVL